IELQPTLEMTSLDLSIQMVSEGIGVTILPALYLDFLENPQISIVRLLNPTLERKIGYIYRKDKFMCMATKAFIDLVTETSEGIQKAQLKRDTDQESCYKTTKIPAN